MAGFGRESGPAHPPPKVTFGQFSRPPTPSVPNIAAAPPPREPEGTWRPRSPSLPFDNPGAAPRPHQYLRGRRPEAPQSVPSHPSPYQNLLPPYTSTGNHRSPPYRSIEPSAKLGDGQKSFYKDYDAQPYTRFSAVTEFTVSQNSGISVTPNVAQSKDMKRTRSPPLSYDDDLLFANTSQSAVPSYSVQEKTQSPTRAFKDNNSVDTFHPAGKSQRLILSSPMPDNNSALPHQDQSRVLPKFGISSEKSYTGQVADAQGYKRTWSPPMFPFNGVTQDSSQSSLNDTKRLNNKSNVPFGTPDSHISQRLVSYEGNVTASTRSASSPFPKRSRSPPLLSTDEGLRGNINSSQYDTEREMQAKAKRLARFKVELSEHVQKDSVGATQRILPNKHENSFVERQKFAGAQSMESARNYSNEDGLSDHGSLEKSTIIIGLCPDMCPESERGERERKGDLDRYERVDGDRNQTSKCLAVKKYNRTAEREANLIRPMPILQQTVNYLLDLLDQPYDESFLPLYNFLWDRMRAIRMDLRMQHIFNQAAINMLEQMIRLHVIAMHELCEYTKGEGFSEGFDAHLNIEQMNKTSVELFQMYDDHRKKGINVPTEKEFRGYYALLKLDKHPGYKVEPAELSLELAKMTPEIRQTPEVLFARDVARACRTGNFIAFFRLARKSSYLQACLMHAHFAKLRTLALASLHAGLLNNQGLPVAHVCRWLVMEEEDIESLLKYHGFSIKEFEEPYMVKEGPFLNSDKDYPTKCSKLVHMKRSGKVVEDVTAPSQEILLPIEVPKAVQPRKHENKAIPSVKRKTSSNAVDEQMPDSETYSTLKIRKPTQQMIKPTVFSQQSKDNLKLSSAPISPWGFSTSHSPTIQHSPSKFQAAKISVEKKSDNNILDRSPEKKIVFGVETTPIPIIPRASAQDRSPSSKIFDYSSEDPSSQSAATSGKEDEDLLDIHHENEKDDGMGDRIDEQMDNENDLMANQIDEEVAVAKLKLMLRLWRRRCLRQKELREQRQLAANAALNSLSLGPPIQQKKDQLRTLAKFDIDHSTRERLEKHERSWSRLNVSDVTLDILSRRNPDAKCLCWKIILFSQRDEKIQGTLISHSMAGRWLSSKLVPSQKDYEGDDLIVSSPGLSIWKKSFPSQSGVDQTHCFSVVRETEFANLNDTASGASAILFLMSESTPWKHQKAQLHKLVMSIPNGSRLPLLILSFSNFTGLSDPYSTIINELGLNDIDRSRVNSFWVKILIDNQRTGHSDVFFSDEQLREGLKWLASESSPQPVVFCVKTREIILSHLSYNLEALGKLSDHEVGPNHCISAFNEALNRSLDEIEATAKSNPVNWPCHEIELVEDSNYNHFIAKSYLPSIGWSSTVKIESFKCALRDLKLPMFADDIIALLSKGSNMGKEIENQRLQLQDYLTKYLTESTGMMGISMATKEASIMLERSSSLELHDSSYYCIIPKWVMIFQRAFNWRLMSLTSGELSSAYVSRHQLSSTPTFGDLEPSFCCLSHPSLDEIIEVSCSPINTQKTQLWPQTGQPLPQIASYGQVEEPAEEINLAARGTNFSEEHGRLPLGDDVCNINCKSNDTTGEKPVSRYVTKEADSLSELLERCNIMQNKNEKKLYVYF